MDYLDQMPGFSGSIDFIHKLNIPFLFKVSGPVDFKRCQVSWMPSHLEMTYADAEISFSEKKFISWDDCLVSCQKWVNKSTKVIKLDLELNDKVIGQTYKDSRYPFEIISDFESNLNKKVILPGESLEFYMAVSLALKGENLDDKLIRYRSLPNEKIIKSHVKDYQSWFDKAPDFKCDNKLLNKTWAYRWFILRHNLADPKCGHLKYPLYFEGRSHKMSKEAYKPKGWEFTKQIPLSSPMHILDGRWYHEKDTLEGIVKNLIESQDSDGQYRVQFVEESGGKYANFMGWAVYQAYLIHGNTDFVKEVIEPLKKQINGWIQTRGSKLDHLIIEDNHNHTGKEYQPSYWYFDGFPDDCKDKSYIRDLKRVDRSIYHYLNIRGMCDLLKIVGQDASFYENLLVGIEEDVLNKMWDENTEFFYDISAASDEKAMVKNIVGFYPFWAGFTSHKHQGAFKYLFSSYFSNGSSFASVASDCPVYAPEGGWKGNFIKGRNGCMWNGPSWPYTNSIMLDVLGKHARKDDLFAKAFKDYLEEFSWMHYQFSDLDRPYLVEHYNSVTGEALSDEVDYNHSYYIDLIIRHVVGLDVSNGIHVNPLDIGLKFFSLTNLRVRGKKVDIYFNCQGYDGLNVFVNGEKHA
ncbi:hypothetical protein EZV73_18205 [Acidaminobacter sp. JC074]|uniref:MGH1-like glycoside hydrolase domain-containing protein n=1 Tax=Acidaminobacter sp. JC074 TaxID=2530199 RepID=UPI001F10B425|nr:hypothetical protein [Acidaminobacter sp. JC074]MCH4889520.1 hypothetical protein [Acidaminobacter sp. JC074]